MLKIYSILEEIFQNKGKNHNNWEDIKNIIQNKNDEILPFCFLIKNRINSGDKQDILLALNILDFAVDHGKPLLWSKIDNKDFLSCIINILKNNQNPNLQNTALYLIQKWTIKFQNYPNLQNCKDVFNSLKKSNIMFPNNIKNTYISYINPNNSINNNNNNFNKQNNNNELRQSRIASDPKDYIKTINLDLNANSYEKKYQRLVNKLYDWTRQIQEINIYINSKNFQNKERLQMLYNDLKAGKEQLIFTIQGSQINDEKLMKISLNICEDMVMTLDRYEKLIKGQNPGPFLSSFTRNDNPFMYKYANKNKNSIEYHDFKYQGPLEKLGNLGFGDSLMTQYMDDEVNENNKELNNNFNNLFNNIEVSTKLDESKSNNIKDAIFTNMSNSNINNSTGIFNKSRENNSNKINNFSNNNNKNARSLVINNNPNGKIANNNDIKRLINNNVFEKNNDINHLYQTQKYKSSFKI